MGVTGKGPGVRRALPGRLCEPLLGRVARVVVFCFVALSATLVVQSLWTGILAVNLKVSAAIPWSVAVMALLLWAIWRYFGGAWGPATTQDARRRYRRAEPVPGPAFRWAMVAGFLGLGALVGLWLVLGQLARVPGNPSANFADYPVVTVVAVIAMASAVGAVIEELGLRGYMLTRLESQVGGWMAVVIVAVAIAPGHGLTQGFAWPTLLWYFAADVMFGALALLTRSILPGIVVHAVGLLLFFSVIWPTDRYRHPAPLGLQGRAFWIELLACLALTALSLLAFRQLGSAGPQSGPHPSQAAAESTTSETR
jgi:membrane protease YdiL (CAAX protease family)